MQVTAFQLHKRSSYEFKFIQDKFSMNLDRKCVAIADGSTQSFESGKWAESLCKAFTENPTFDREELIARFKLEAEKLSSEEYKWNNNLALAALEKEKRKRGSTATFLGLQLDQSRISILAVGDCNLFLINKNGLTPVIFDSLDKLDANNLFLNSRTIMEDELLPESFYANKFELESGSSILLATDALSRLLLKSPEVVDKLLLATTYNEFYDFCIEKWDSRELEEDDITFLVVKNSAKGGNGTFVPPPDFSFPKEQELSFEPNFNNNQIQNDISPDMINNLIETVQRQFNEIRQLKAQLKMIKTLLILSIFIGFVNLLGFVWNGNREQPKTKILKEERPKRQPSYSVTITKPNEVSMDRPQKVADSGSLKSLDTISQKDKKAKGKKEKH